MSPAFATPKVFLNLKEFSPSLPFPSPHLRHRRRQKTNDVRTRQTRDGNAIFSCYRLTALSSKCNIKNWPCWNEHSQSLRSARSQRTFEVSSEYRHSTRKMRQTLSLVESIFAYGEEFLSGFCVRRDVMIMISQEPARNCTKYLYLVWSDYHLGRTRSHKSDRQPNRVQL